MSVSLEPRLNADSVANWTAEVECGGQIVLMTDMDALAMAAHWESVAERIRRLSRVRAEQ